MSGMKSDSSVASALLSFDLPVTDDYYCLFFSQIVYEFHYHHRLHYFIIIIHPFLFIAIHVFCQSVCLPPFILSPTFEIHTGRRIGASFVDPERSVVGRGVVLVARVGGSEVERAMVEAQLALAFALSASSSSTAWTKGEKVTV